MLFSVSFAQRTSVFQRPLFQIHRVSVRCITSMGQSHDNQCTILVGKGKAVPFPVPTNKQKIYFILLFLKEVILTSEPKYW